MFFVKPSLTECDAALCFSPFQSPGSWTPGKIHFEQIQEFPKKQVYQGGWSIYLLWFSVLKQEEPSLSSVTTEALIFFSTGRLLFIPKALLIFTTSNCNKNCFRHFRSSSIFSELNYRIWCSTLLLPLSEFRELDSWERMFETNRRIPP